MLTQPRISDPDREAASSFVQGDGLPFLTANQNPDGGWGYHPGSQSSVEATSWTLLALRSLPQSSVLKEVSMRGFDWLGEAQLPDGSWPPFLAQRQGCWVTALACLAFDAQGESPDRMARGLAWLVNAWPAEGNLWWRLRHRLFSRSSVVRQNSSLRGWSWTPGTASWVEPTSCALILLHGVAAELRPPGAARRIRLAESMLYDRMCPEGGWNSGNPLVYGVAGEPRVGPTVWALLGLRDHRERPENQMSLDWLEAAYAGIRGPGSLALAHICLTACGRCLPPLAPTLQALCAPNGLFQDVMAVAWATIALGSKPAWLAPSHRPVKSD